METVFPYQSLVLYPYINFNPLRACNEGQHCAKNQHGALTQPIKKGDEFRLQNRRDGTLDKNIFKMYAHIPIPGSAFQHINILILRKRGEGLMASETNGSTSKHPEGSTPILTVNIPGGLAINLLGIIAETCPICFSVFQIYPNPPILPIEDKATNDLGPESPGSYTPESHAFPLVTSVATGTSENVSDCPFKEKLNPCRHSSSGFGASKSIKRPKPSKHLNPLKPPKPFKHLKPLNPPKPSNHLKPLKPPKPLNPPKPSKHLKPLKPPKPLKHPKPRH